MDLIATYSFTWKSHGHFRLIMKSSLSYPYVLPSPCVMFFYIPFEVNDTTTLLAQTRTLDIILDRHLPLTTLSVKLTDFTP